MANVENMTKNQTCTSHITQQFQNFVIVLENDGNREQGKADPDHPQPGRTATVLAGLEGGVETNHQEQVRNPRPPPEGGSQGDEYRGQQAMHHAKRCTSYADPVGPGYEGGD